MSLETVRVLLWAGVAFGLATSAVCGFFVNVVSEKIAKQKDEANAKLARALNRPLIQMRPTPFDGGKFVKATLHGTRIWLELNIEIKNTGNLPTKFMTFTSSSVATQRMNPPAADVVVPIRLESEGVALAPGASVVLSFKQIIEWPTESEARMNLEGLYANRDWAIEYVSIAAYTNPTDRSQSYRTIGQFRIAVDKASVVKIDHQESDSRPSRK